MTSLRVLTYNAGLLRVALAGHVLLEVAHLEARLAHLVPALQEEDADVICLQEVFRRAHRDRVVAELRPTHPHVARADDRARGWTHGLLIASRHPLRDGRFQAFRAQHWWQRGLVSQGVLMAVVAHTDGAVLSLANAHTTAGGRLGPEAPSVERMRRRQLAEVDARVRAEPHPTLVCGDLNCGPEASPETFAGLLARGYVDAAPGAGPTWEPGNALNRGGPFSGSPAQRVDHVLLDETAASEYRVARAQVVRTDPLVPTVDGLVTTSDHYGLLVDLVREPDRAAGDAPTTRGRGAGPAPD